VLPDQRSYLTDHAAFATPPIAQPATAPTALADLDGDGRDSLVFADDQGLVVFELLAAPGAPPVRIAAPQATAVTTVRRDGGDCVVLTGPTGATLECGLAIAHSSVALSSAPAFGAVVLDVDGDGTLEAVVVHEATLAVYELDSASELGSFELSTMHVAPARACSADFDGDGVGDLAVTTDDTVELWWGIAHDSGAP
jgi:hypothetical protein